MLHVDFPDTRYEDWIAQLEKDLKGKPWTDLQWQLGEDIVVDPFYHPDNYFPQRYALTGQRSNNHWEIGEYIAVGDPKIANPELLEALDGGAEALELSFTKAPSAEELSILLQGVQLEYISLHIVENYAEKNPLHILNALRAFAVEAGFDPSKVRGTIDGTTAGLLAETIPWARHELPAFKTCLINGRSFYAEENSPHELATLLQLGQQIISQLEDAGIAPTEAAPAIQFSVAIGTSYFLEIAKLRALRLLWQNVLKAYGIPTTALEIAAHFAPASQDEYPNTNLIRAATQAMSAVIGGANLLYVLPSNASLHESPTPFTRRIARNVQHLLRLESHLDKVIDPAAGSYYIEKLTEELAQKAWAIFQQNND
ncbi:methylmalonyl-CoA mutase family protein [Haliscomenobacter hydrossis]|uniref:Methylmalonyl-CoA mutase n=1 Tax=Haliscomenobacter hydrossis (strain ATCC 27775 / DSM 1100 / LMG 10767 / O) TaxID=760192 RepID=F4KW56_HALH1|nr:methylmalonyl-CoA mutase family protein [Haliscomenobacter hydrossis]AEE49244.1 Methylmalonyl-CoA mutase [Haliscomenobacter hydrossis DSM 1100]